MKEKEQQKMTDYYIEREQWRKRNRERERQKETVI